MVEITICAKTQPTLFGSRFKTQISGQEIVQDSGQKWDRFVLFSMLLSDSFKGILMFDCQCFDDYLPTKTQGPQLLTLMLDHTY